MTQNEQMFFSPLLPAHIDQMEQIEIECFSVPWSREALEEELENPYAHYVVCTDGAGNVLGYIGSRIVLDSADITNVAVRPVYRRRGIARQLVGRMLEQMAEKGVVLKKCWNTMALISQSPWPLVMAVMILKCYRLLVQVLRWQMRRIK